MFSHLSATPFWKRIVRRPPQPEHRLLLRAHRIPQDAAVAVLAHKDKTGPSALCWVQTSRVAGSRALWRQLCRLSRSYTHCPDTAHFKLFSTLKAV